MNHNEAIECIEELSNLFPNADLQAAELELFRQTLCKFDRDDAVDAIRTHRLKCEFNRPKFNQILANLYDRERRKPAMQQRPGTTARYVDVLRNDLIAKGRAAQQWTDAEVAMRVGQGWALKYPGAGNTDRIRHDVLEMLTRDCGMESAVAAGYADSCFLVGTDFEDAVVDLDRITSGRAA